MTTTDVTTPEVHVYWRGGCGFCVALVRALRKRNLPLTTHHIYEEPGAAALVRSVAGGNETVPTVIIDDHALVNPTAGSVMDLLGELYPEYEPPEPEPRTRRSFLR